MKDFLKALKKGMLLGGVFSVVLGLVLILFPGIVENSLRFLLGGGLFLFGLLEVVFVFAKPNGLLSVGRMIPGILALAVGLVFLFRFDTFVSLFWILVGLAILVDGVYKLQYAFELKAALVKNWWVNLLLALLTLIFASILMIQPFDVQLSMTYLCGALLLANGIFDLVCTMVMASYGKVLKNAAVTFIYDSEEEEESVVEK